MKAVTTVVLFFGVVLIVALSSISTVGIFNVLLTLSPPFAAAEIVEVPKVSLRAVLPREEEIPINLVRNIYDEENFRELYLSTYGKYGITEAEFLIYDPLQNIYCDVCGIFAYSLRFKDQYGAKQAFERMVPPDKPTTRKCDIFFQAEGRKISTAGLGDLSAGIGCSSFFTEVLMYYWKTRNVVLVLLVSGSENMTEEEVKTLADQMQLQLTTGTENPSQKPIGDQQVRLLR